MKFFNLRKSIAPYLKVNFFLTYLSTTKLTLYEQILIFFYQDTFFFLQFNYQYLTWSMTCTCWRRETWESAFFWLLSMSFAQQPSNQLHLTPVWSRIASLKWILSSSSIIELFFICRKSEVFYMPHLALCIIEKLNISTRYVTIFNLIQFCR